MHIVYRVTEAELIQGCIKQDRLAQKRFYERYYGKMMTVCLRYAPDKNTATEILNNGFIKIFNSLEAFSKKGGNTEGWMYRIMVNTAIDYLRSEMRHQHSELDGAVYAEVREDVLAQLEAAQLLDMVQKLTPAYRAVFNLYVVEGYNHIEIGEMLGISEGTSKSNLAKARVKLQQMIKEYNTVNSTAYGK